MPRFRIDDVQSVEHSPTSPANMRSKLGEMVMNSTNCRAKVEAINTDTGEYRVVLQGTLDTEETKWEEI